MNFRLKLCLYVLAVYAAAAIVGMILAILFIRANGTEKISVSETTISSTVSTAPVTTTTMSTTAATTTMAATTAIPTSNVALIGNFTILHRTVSSVDNSAICNYLETAVVKAQINTTHNCTILDKRSGSVKVRYMLVIWNVSNAIIDDVLESLSTQIALLSTDQKTFNVDQSTLTFEDGSGKTFDSFEKLANDTSRVCVAVVNDTLCMCSSGLSLTAAKDSCSPGYVQRYCNQTRRYIQVNSICDEYQDCPDGSDEINCVCDSQYQYACKNGRCIDGSWLCDGVEDCPQGDDEMFPQCDNCSSGQFQCRKSRSCISSNRRCDGRSDCQDSSDENECVSLVGSRRRSGLIDVNYEGTTGYRVCSDDWNDAWADRVCNVLGFGDASNTTFPTSNGPFVSLNLRSSSNFLAYASTTRCPSRQAVSIICQRAECGVRTTSDSVGQYIVNGQRAQRGAWPWQVVVIKGEQSRGEFKRYYICGGMLITDRWILTAAQCLRIESQDRRLFGYTGLIKTDNLQILLGTISLDSNNNRDMVEANADGVYIHPRYDATTHNNDIGLIRLRRSVSFSDTVRPICPPDKEQDLSRLNVCVDTGFGDTAETTNSNNLQQTRMNILPDAKCSQIYSGYRSERQLCIGTNPTDGISNICTGDSGGPFACQDSSGVWMAVGVNSFVRPGGAADDPASERCQHSFVTRISAYLDWINSTLTENST